MMGRPNAEGIGTKFPNMEKESTSTICKTLGLTLVTNRVLRSSEMAKEYVRENPVFSESNRAKLLF